MDAPSAKTTQVSTYLFEGNTVKIDSVEKKKDQAYAVDGIFDIAYLINSALDDTPRFSMIVYL